MPAKISQIRPAVTARAPQAVEMPRVKSVRTRVSSLRRDQRRVICDLFDDCGGDADYTAERCGIIGVQRGDVLAVVLADTRAARRAA